jgi:hypothetical protein
MRRTSIQVSGPEPLRRRASKDPRKPSMAKAFARKKSAFAVAIESSKPAPEPTGLAGLAALHDAVERKTSGAQLWGTARRTVRAVQASSALWDNVTPHLKNMHRQHLEAQLTRAAQRNEVQLETEAPADMALWKQGDADMYTDEALDQRFLLRHTISVCKALKEWWEAVAVHLRATRYAGARAGATLLIDQRECVPHARTGAVPRRSLARR